MLLKNNNYVIGVDGGGAKTVAALSNLDGKILNIAKSGPSSPRNIGMEIAIKNVAEAIKKVLGRHPPTTPIKILSVFIGLPAIEEEYKLRREEIKKELKRHREISQIFEGKIIIGSDQLVAFRSGTDETDGVLIISGSGCVTHGWRNKKEAHASGWGWLNDEGSGFWIGQKAFQTVFRELDARGPKTLITKLAFQNLRVKNKEELMFKIYSKNPTEIVPLFSIYCDQAWRKGDAIAKNILVEAGKELALSANTVIRKLNFQRDEFPLVLIGGVFKSKLVLETVKKEIKKLAPQAKFIRPKSEPVIGAIKLALEQIKNYGKIN